MLHSDYALISKKSWKKKDKFCFFEIRFFINKDKYIKKSIIHFKIPYYSAIGRFKSRSLQNFLNDNLWDEVRIIESKDKKLGAGISGPIIDRKVDETIELAEDNVLIYYHP